MADDISAPFTIEVLQTGRGGLTVPQALVDGRQKSIVWAGGAPLPITGDCRLLTGEIRVLIEHVTATFHLDGAARAFSGSSCSLSSAVAVGEAGLSAPLPSVSFAAPREVAFTTTGGAKITVVAIRRYEGRSGGLTLAGDLTVEGDGRAASKEERVELESGTWVAEVTGGVDPGTLRVVATLEGRIRLGPRVAIPVSD